MLVALNFSWRFWQQRFVPESTFIEVAYEEYPRRFNKILSEIFNLLMLCELICMHTFMHS